MGGHAPHGQHNASDARFVACPGKAEGQKEAERPPALQAPPRPHSRRKRRTPPPPPSPPPSIRTPWTRPAASSPHRNRAGPPQPHARTHNADPDSPPSGRAVGGGGAQDPKRPTQRSKAPPRGSPAAAPTTPSQVGGNRDRTAPPQGTPDGARDRGRTREGARTTWNGPTSAQCRDHARCGRHTTQRGGERTPRERERTHTKRTRGDYRKGNRTERAERTDRMEWRTSARG